MSGQSIFEEKYTHVDSISQNMVGYPSGNYLVNIYAGDLFQSFKVLKQ